MSSISKLSLVPAVALLAAMGAPSAQAEVTTDIFGRLQVDMNQYSSDVTELGSGTEMRRARIGVGGNLADDWKYKMEIDFADGDLVVKDAYVEHKMLTIGQFKVPQSLDVLTSSKYMTFIERAAVSDSLTLDRRMGVGAGFSGDNWTADVAGFGQNADVQDSGKDEGVGFSGRVTYLPWQTDDSLLHLGVWGSWEQPQNTVDEALRLRARPEAHVTSVRLIDTGTIDYVDDIVKMGVEGSLVMGSVSVQGEYITADVNRTAPDAVTVTPNFSFDGYYVQASYLTGGNSRAYKGGQYGRTKATNAWEYAIRYSNLDLTGGSDTAMLPGKGGEQNVLTLGVNYYINPNMRVMVNYLDIDTKGYNNGSVDESPSAINLRFSMDF